MRIVGLLLFLEKRGYKLMILRVNMFEQLIFTEEIPNDYIGLGVEGSLP